MEDLNFIPSDREVRLEPNQSLIFKFSNEYKLEYVNDFFTDFTGYEIHDVIGEGVEGMKHSDIPKLISSMLYESVENKKNINIILKNTTKDGRFYWFLTDFQYEIDEENKLLSFKYYRRFPSKSAIPTLEKLYKKLLDIENHASIEVAEKYLYGFLEEKNMSFSEYTAFLSKGEDFKSMVQKVETPQNLPAGKAGKKSWFRK